MTPHPRLARHLAWLALLFNLGAFAFNVYRCDLTEAAISTAGIAICALNFWVLKWVPRLIKP